MFNNMEFYINILKSSIFRPSTKYIYNLFFFKYNLNTLYNTYLYPHFFLHLKGAFKLTNLSFKINFFGIRFLFLILVVILVTIIFL